jgi:uncharacterized OsmC-like protein
MTQHATVTKREPVPMNGVDTPTLFATINAVRDQPELAQFTFRASNQWQKGTHSRGRCEAFDGAGGRHTHTSEYGFDADHPEVLVGTGLGPTPVEFLLHGLAACLTAGIGNIAAARGIELESVESSVEGEMDMRGILGLSDEVRNGYQNLTVNFTIKGNAPADKLEKLVAQSMARSAVFDVMTNGVPISVNVNAV